MEGLQKKRICCYAILGLALGYIALQKRAALSQILSVTIYSLLLTVLLAPLCAKLEQRGIGSTLAVLISIGGFALAVLLIIALFIPYLITHTIDLVEYMMPTLTGLLAFMSAQLGKIGFNIQIGDSLLNAIGTTMGRATNILARFGITIAAQMSMLLFSVVVAYYLLKERKVLVNYLLLLIPLGWRTFCISAVLGCKNALSGYLAGVVKTSMFISIAIFAGFTLLGVRDALLLSLFMGIFELFPYIGPVLAVIPILLVTLPGGFYHTCSAILLTLIVQQIEGNFISPYFTASSTSLPPLTALISVFVFGVLFGLWGILLAIPVVVCIRSIWWSVQSVTI